MDPQHLDYAREIFTELVAAWTVRTSSPPNEPDAAGLADKAIQMAEALRVAQQLPARPLSAPLITSDRPPSSTGTTFAAVATEWMERIVKRSAGNSRQSLKSQFKRYVLPHLGNRPVGQVTPREILSVIRSIESAGYSTLAYQTFKDLRFMYRYALVAGLSDQDPTATLRRAINKPKSKGMRVVLDPESIGRLLVAIRAYEAKPRSTARHMLRLAPMVFLRPSELRTLEWKQVDLDAATAVIPAAAMKSRRPHIVPLARQAVGILRDVQKMTGSGRFVFTSGRVDKPLDDSIFYVMLGRVGFRRIVTAHGFRTMAATWLSEQGWRQEAVSRQLSHMGGDRTGRIYNRAEYLPERRKMMQSWANHLEILEDRAKRAGRSHAPV